MSVPILSLNLPRPLRAIHQIELSSECNLRCVYCTSPTLGRPKLHMTRELFERALFWVRHFIKNKNNEQRAELNLAGIGESTLHPNFAELVHVARAAVGADVPLVVTTNGLLITEELVLEVKSANLGFFVSLHRPEKAGPAVEILRRHGLFLGASSDPALASIDWAGQVKWPVSTPADTRPCPWIRDGWGMVFADGRISTCCLDSDGRGVVGHVDDDPAVGVKLKPYSLCEACDQVVGVEGYNQRPPKPGLPIVKE